MSVEAKEKTWCETDHHDEYEWFADFNEWLDQECEASFSIPARNLGVASQKSKALFTGDKSLYQQEFALFRNDKLHECLEAIDDHWSENNLSRFRQLIDQFANGNVVPFVGAGLAVSSGFPTWKNHLRKQSVTAALDPEETEILLASGKFEDVISNIVSVHGRAGFVQQIRDDFYDRDDEPSEAMLLIAELTKGMVITTNFDHTLEQAFKEKSIEQHDVINGYDDPDMVFKTLMDDRPTILNLHGDVSAPDKCILGKQDYDTNYGDERIDFSLNVPRNLANIFMQRSILFVGCSLENDRTMQVFLHQKNMVDEAGDGPLIPQHFAICPLPEEQSDIANRNAFLLNHGISPIWYPSGEHEYVDVILDRCMNELRYRGIKISDTRTKVSVPDQGKVSPQSRFSLQKIVPFLKPR